MEAKQPFKRMYLSKKAQKGTKTEKESLITKQFMSIERFLDVSKCLLNKFVGYQLHIQNEYLIEIDK